MLLEANIASVGKISVSYFNLLLTSKISIVSSSSGATFLSLFSRTFSCDLWYCSAGIPNAWCINVVALTFELMFRRPFKPL